MIIGKRIKRESNIEIYYNFGGTELVLYLSHKAPRNTRTRAPLKSWGTITATSAKRRSPPSPSTAADPKVRRNPRQSSLLRGTFQRLRCAERENGAAILELKRFSDTSAPNPPVRVSGGDRAPWPGPRLPSPHRTRPPGSPSQQGSRAGQAGGSRDPSPRY